LSGRVFRVRQQVREGLFAFFGSHCHAFKKDGRRLYRPPPTGTVNFPFPCFRQVPSQLHDDREVSRVKSFFSHAP
ncbi:MAG: hypothetical protein WA615_06265, partial [Bradyrhizobium sp.]|uniref:hypothetical protein n=1 Tax=Bradyrhizobium sp. TaxID=376 RepID=UPI003C7ABA91